MVCNASYAISQDLRHTLASFNLFFNLIFTPEILKSVNLWLPFVFSFLFQTLISAPFYHIAYNYFIFLIKTDRGVSFFSFGQEGGCQKTKYYVRGYEKNFPP